MAVDDPADRALVVVQDTLSELRKKPRRQQMMLGVGSGFVAGYIGAKVGRLAALVLGGTLIALQCAVQHDYVKVDWKRLKHLRRDLWHRNSPFKESLKQTLTENRVFFGSFAGGFLIAVAVF